MTPMTVVINLKELRFDSDWYSVGQDEEQGD